MMPGVTTIPLASISSAPGGVCTLPSGPAATILPCAKATAPSSMAGPAAVRTRAWRRTTARCCTQVRVGRTGAWVSSAAVLCGTWAEDEEQAMARAMVGTARIRMAAHFASGRRPDATSLQQAPGKRLEDRAGAVANPQLGQDGGDVVLDGPFRHAERRADLAVGISAGQEPQHLQLAPGERLRGLVPRRGLQRGEPAYHRVAHCGLEPRLPRCHRADGVAQLARRGVLEQVPPRAGADGGEEGVGVV